MGYFGSVNIFWFFKCPHSRPPRDPLASCQSRQPFIVRPKLKGRFRWLDSSREEVSSSSRMDLCLSIAQRSYLWSLAAQHEVPAVSDRTLPIAEGGLLSYGATNDDMFVGAARYVDRILKGEKPPDLPVQEPTKYELAINLKTAKALGLAIPPALLASADEVVE